METNQSPLKPVKISCGYSSKASQNYQSENYSINLEMEVMVNGKTSELEQKADLLYDLCRRIVTKQRSVSIDELLAPNEQSPPANQPAPAKAPPMNTNPRPYPSNDIASEKQVKCIFAIARANGVKSKDVKETVLEQYNKEVEELTKKEASEVINFYKAAA